jgi:hypothetical protein
MPSRRQAVLTISGPEDQTITYLADFDRLTLTLTQEGGYRRNPEGAKAIAPATADAFWQKFGKLAADGLRPGAFDMLGGRVWKFTARDGKKTYEVSGLLRDTQVIEDDPAEDSFAELAALFDLLRK